MKKSLLRKQEKRELLSCELLDGLGEDELCEVYNGLNSWKWPSGLGPEPQWWEGSDKHFAICKIMPEIKERIGHKELSRWHWLHNLNRTDAEFEKWYWKELSNAVFRY